MHPHTQKFCRTHPLHTLSHPLYLTLIHTHTTSGNTLQNPKVSFGEIISLGHEQYFSFLSISLGQTVSETPAGGRGRTRDRWLAREEDVLLQDV
jgi:hypothetical protein